MRVLAISHSCVADVNQQLYVTLSRLNNVHVELVTPTVWKNSYSTTPQSVRKLPSASFELHALPIRMTGNISLYHYSQGLSAVFRQSRPDVVFVDQEPWTLSMAQMVRLCRQARIPLVGYTKQNILKSYPPPFRWIERLTYASAAAIAVLTDEARDILRRKGYSGPCPLLDQGYDLALFAPTDSQSRRKQLGLQGVVIGYMGRLEAQKGLNTLLDAARLLMDQGVGTPISLLIVGAGSEEQHLKHRATEIGIEAQCVFTGAVPHREAGEYMACMDIFALPSLTTPRWKEQFGRVIVEAMACGVPVVGSDSGQIPFVIADMQGGLVFREGDATDLAAKLRELIVDPARRISLGEAGCRSVRCRYTYDAVAQQFYEILEHVHAS